jgi:hypothetical protein
LFLPEELELKSLQQFDPRLTLLDDRPLIIACQQLGWHGLITNNYKVLYEPHEVAAIVVATPSIVVAAEGLGHDPLRAAGALLLGLPGLVQRLVATGPTAMSFESQPPRWPSQGPAGSPPTRPPTSTQLLGDGSFGRRDRTGAPVPINGRGS